MIQSAYKLQDSTENHERIVDYYERFSGRRLLFISGAFYALYKKPIYCVKFFELAR